MWEEIVDTLNAVNGVHAGHPRGPRQGNGLRRARFTATPEAAKLSRAAHLQGDPVKATVRFSNASGNPQTSDANPIAGRGMAVKFHLAGRRRDRPGDGAAGRVHGPQRRGLPRLHQGADPRPRDRPARPREDDGLHRRAPRDRHARSSSGLPKLAPTTSFATSGYNGLHAFALVDADGETTWGRYSSSPRPRASSTSPRRRWRRPTATTSSTRSASASAAAAPPSGSSSRLAAGRRLARGPDRGLGGRARGRRPRRARGRPR